MYGNVTTSHRISQSCSLATRAHDLPTDPTTPSGEHQLQPYSLLQPHRGVLATTTNRRANAFDPPPQTPNSDHGPAMWWSVILLVQSPTLQVLVENSSLGPSRCSPRSSTMLNYHPEERCPSSRVEYPSESAWNSIGEKDCSLEHGGWSRQFL